MKKRIVQTSLTRYQKEITEYNESYQPTNWNIEFIMMNGQRHWLSPEDAIRFNRRVVAWYSNIQGWPEHHEDWAWTANHSECLLPAEILEEH